MILAAASIVSTLSIGGLLALITALVIRSMYRKKKQTGSCLRCSGGCAGCPHACGKNEKDSCR